MRKRHGVSVPSASDRFDFLEVGHGIGMSAEVNVLPFHVLHLAGKVQIIHIGPMLLGGHADLATVLVHFVDDRVLRFQLVHTVGKRGVVLVGIRQIHHNITVDLRKGVLYAGWQVKIAVAHGAHFLIVFIIQYTNRKAISKVQILSFGLFRLPWGCGADRDGGRTDPIFFGDVLDVTVVDVHKAAAV